MDPRNDPPAIVINQLCRYQADNGTANLRQLNRIAGLVGCQCAPTGPPASSPPTYAWTGRHEELTNLAAYLMADGAAYINGEVVTIDGGEWLKGAGQFNFAERLSEAEWEAMRPRKKGRP